MRELRRGPRAGVPEQWFSHVQGLRRALETKLSVSRVEIVDVHPRPRWLVLKLMVPPHRRLFAKLALPGPDVVSEVRRPRLVPVSNAADRLQSEAEALWRLEDRLAEGDPDLAAVRVVLWGESPPLLVVEWVEGKALSQALSPLAAPGRARPRPELLEGAGRWLRIFHSLTDGEPLAYQFPEDVVSWLAAVEEYFAGRPRADRWRSLTETLARAVERHGELDPEIGLHHGDMAPRNLMVRDDGRIVGIDAGVKWQAPRAHDLGVFLLDLHLRSTLGNGARAREFFTGYGFPADDRWAADLFSAIAVVDRQVAWTARDEVRMGKKGRRALEGARLNTLANHLTDSLRGLNRG